MKTGPVLDYMHSFKSFEVTGVNQELLTLTHVMKGCTITKISSTSDPNIAKVQPSFLKQVLPRFRAILDLIKPITKFLASSLLFFFDYSH